MSLFDIFKGQKSQLRPSFAAHVDRFWSEFAGIIDEVKADLNAKNFEPAMQKVEEKLKICLAEPTFLIGMQGDKLDLVLTPEGMRHRLFWLNFMKQRMPVNLSSKMICTLGKQPSLGANNAIKMYDTDVAPAECDVWAEFGEKLVDIRVYSPNLGALLAQDENQAYNLLFILLDNTIGETAVINVIGNVELLTAPTEGESVKLNELGAMIQSKYGQDATRDPMRNFSVYKLEPHGQSHRTDVVVGSSCLTQLISQYLDGQSDIYDEGDENNVNFCYLAFSHGGDMQAGFDLRGQIEDSGLFDEFAPEILHLGGANGTNYTYIDLISFDPDKLDALVNKIEQKYGVKIEICDFKAAK